MRLLSVHVYSVNDRIKIRFETIKSKPLVEKTREDHFGRLNRVESFSCQGYDAQQNKYDIHIPDTANKTSEKSENILSVYSVIIELPDDPSLVFNLLSNASDIFRVNQCDHVFIDTKSIKDHILHMNQDGFDDKTSYCSLNYSKNKNGNPIYDVNISVDDYIQSKNVLPENMSLAKYLEREIIAINPALDYLEASQLTKPDVDDTIKQNILKKIVKLAKDKNDLEIPHKFMDNLHDYAMKTLINPCLGKKAHCGEIYKYNYTELTLLEHAEIHLRDDGRASFKLADNWSYQSYYAKGRQNFGLLEDELRYLCNIIGLELAPDSNFNSEIIFTPACTELLFKKGLLYDTEYLNQFIKSHHLDKETNEVIAANPQQNESNCGNVSQSGMFSHPDVKSTKPELSTIQSSYPKEKPLFDDKRGMFYWGKRIDESPSQEPAKPDLELKDERGNSTGFVYNLTLGT